MGITICLYHTTREKNKIMINIEPFRHHNNHEDGARIILTGSSESVLPPAALWVAQSYRLAPVRGASRGMCSTPVFHQGCLVDPGQEGPGRLRQGCVQDQGTSSISSGVFCAPPVYCAPLGRVGLKEEMFWPPSTLWLSCLSTNQQGSPSRHRRRA